MSENVGLRKFPEFEERKKIKSKVDRKFLSNRRIRVLSKRRQKEPLKQIEEIRCLRCRTSGVLIPAELKRDEIWRVKCRICGFEIVVIFKKGNWKLIKNENEYASLLSKREQKRMKRKATRNIKEWVKNTW